MTICLLKVRLFSRVLRDSTTRFVGPSVRRSVRRSVGPSVRPTLLFLGFCCFWPHCSCPNDRVTSIMAPAHPHATGVAVYPALFFFILRQSECCTTNIFRITIFSRVHATLQPTLSVCPSFRLSVILCFFAAPAHPHATSPSVYGLV